MTDEKRADAPAPRRPPTHSTFESVIDQLLSKARSQGHFDNLEGKGRPLDREDDALVPEDARAAFRMLKNAGFAPAWIEARRSLEGERAELGAWLRRANERWPRLGGGERETLRAEYRGKLQALNSAILTHNLTCPESAGQIPGVRMDVELAKLGGGE
jgi:hypothetical protein